MQKRYSFCYHSYMSKWILIVVVLLTSSCAVLQNNSFVLRSTYLMRNDSFVYALPYQKGTSHLVAQGYESLLSHAGDYAIDFKMKQGTKVMAAREGIVVYVRDSMRAGGVGKKYVGTANSIAIKHSDGTYGHYLHLQYKGAIVAVGDSIRQGQWIGLSGSTGFSAFPHLHFEVTRKPAVSDDDFPIPFLTKKGAKFLQPLHWYKAL